MVKCKCCGKKFEMDELESEVIKQGLEMISLCPNCGAKSSNDYLERFDS